MQKATMKGATPTFTLTDRKPDVATEAEGRPKYAYGFDRMPNAGDNIVVFRCLRLTMPKGYSEDVSKWFPAHVKKATVVHSKKSLLVLDIYTTKDTKAMFTVVRDFELCVTQDGYGCSGKKNWFFPTEEKLKNISATEWWLEEKQPVGGGDERGKEEGRRR